VRPGTWAELDAKFARYPFLRAGAVDPAEVDAASGAVRVNFPEDYREFLLRHGGAIVGPYPVFGVRSVEAMGNEWSVVEMTKRFRSDRWPGTDDWAIISSDHAGNPVGIDTDGRVWVSDHDFGGISLVADSFEDFLRKRCLQSA
jgi:cell wall assembly regulator SMI1